MRYVGRGMGGKWHTRGRPAAHEGDAWDTLIPRGNELPTRCEAELDGIGLSRNENHSTHIPQDP